MLHCITKKNHPNRRAHALVRGHKVSNCSFRSQTSLSLICKSGGHSSSFSSLQIIAIPSSGQCKRKISLATYKPSLPRHRNQCPSLSMFETHRQSSLSCTNTNQKQSISPNATIHNNRFFFTRTVNPALGQLAKAQKPSYLEPKWLQKSFQKHSPCQTNLSSKMMTSSQLATSPSHLFYACRPFSCISHQSHSSHNQLFPYSQLFSSRRPSYLELQKKSFFKDIWDAIRPKGSTGVQVPNQLTLEQLQHYHAENSHLSYGTRMRLLREQMQIESERNTMIGPSDSLHFYEGPALQDNLTFQNLLKELEMETVVLPDTVYYGTVEVTSVNSDMYLFFQNFSKLFGKIIVGKIDPNEAEDPKVYLRRRPPTELAPFVKQTTDYGGPENQIKGKAHEPVIPLEPHWDHIPTNDWYDYIELDNRQLCEEVLKLTPHVKTLELFKSHKGLQVEYSVRDVSPTTFLADLKRLINIATILQSISTYGIDDPYEPAGTSLDPRSVFTPSK